MLILFMMLLGFFSVRGVLPLLAQLFRRQGIIKENYRREPIPAALGLVFPLTMPLLFLVQLGYDFFYSTSGLSRGEFYAFLFLTTGFGLLGLADDL